jgi:hypothetical protein
VAVLIACALAALPAAAGAAQGPEGGPLAPSLQELSKPSVQALPADEQAQLLGIAAEGPGSLIGEDGEVLVEARFESGAIASLPALRQIGGDVTAASQRYQLATVSIAAADLQRLATVPGIAAVTPVRAPVLRAGPCQGGAVISEGIGQLKVEAARTKLAEILGEPSNEGEGLTIGVLSDSMAQATEAVGGGAIATKQPEDVAANELPGGASSCEGEKEPVRELEPYKVQPGQPPTDEGRAMLQILHDVVPRAQLAFHSAFNGEPAFAEGIEKLAEPVFAGGAGADLIVDDVGYFEEPFFQDGPVAAAIDKVVGDGVTYLTSAGNDSLFDAEGNEIASWEAPLFRDSGDCPQAVRTLTGFKGTHCLDFNPEAPVDRTFGIKVEAGATLTADVQWNQPRGGVSTDLDVFLLDAAGRLLTASAENNVKVQKPVEVLQWTNESAAERTVQVVVNRFTGANRRLKLVLLQNGGGVTGTEYPRSGGGDVVGPAVYGHAGAAAAITVGAVPYSNSNRVERYSSRGPVTHYFGPVEGSGPAPPLGSPEVISKPNVAATDCGRTTFFSAVPKTEPGVWRFCGTSAAAPHAAGVAAMAIEASGGSAEPDEVAALLEDSGQTVGGFGPCAAGGGLINALTAVEAAAGGPTMTPALCGVPNSSDPVFVAPGDWGVETPPLTVEPVQPVTPTPPLTTPDPIVPPTNPPETKPAPKAPSTSIRRHPSKLVRTAGPLARVVFRFAAAPAASAYRCQFDGSPWKPCTATLMRWFGLGQHVVRVEAKSAEGLYDPTPAVFRFRVAPSL